ncbi:hypothetical protein [Nannocystis pusilla]|uniref:hypothetical protein n=1 Tax=Nannocystis pusilla TaxID=889268 RepID=UPI003BF21E8D
MPVALGEDRVLIGVRELLILGLGDGEVRVVRQRRARRQLQLGEVLLQRPQARARTQRRPQQRLTVRDQLPAPALAVLTA